jgi:hypothetical protein
VGETSPERYVRLGLRVGRHVEGIVDAYFGPPELAAAVDAEPLAEPAALVSAAEELLDELDDGWLRDQVAGLRTYAGVLAGESRSYADEVLGCYGVRPVRTDESVFEAAHRELDHLLPGSGPLVERHERWEASIRVPPERVERALAAVIDRARAATGALVDLPGGEGVTLEIVTGEPWLAFCFYTGGLQSRIAVNSDLPLSAIELLVLAAHETYPGHHAERACKDALLVRRGGLLEESIVLVPTPQSLVAEGIATLAPPLLFETDDGGALGAVLHDVAGVEFDLDQGLAIERARQPLRWAELNAALHLHEDGASPQDVRAYLEHWALMSPGLASHMIRFFEEPTSRTYVVTYPAGRELCGAFVAGDPSRFRRLLTEQVRVGDLDAAHDGVAPSDNSQSGAPEVTVR